MMIYLDYNATTPVDVQALDMMLPFHSEQFWNAASEHRAGRSANGAVEHARNQLAQAIGASSQEVVFTSGATESNNAALLGVTRSATHRRKHIISCTTEHKAVLDPLRQLSREGFEVQLLSPDSDGVLDLGALRAALRQDTVLVSLMLANNETGVIGPVRDAAELAHAAGALVHTDAAQALGKLPVNVRELGVDLASFSAHKFYGPKGIGALYVRRRVQDRLEPIIHGGGHERGLRSGTLNVPAIVGMGHAAATAVDRLETDRSRLTDLRERLWASLRESVPEAVRHGRPGLPNTLNVGFPGVDADNLMGAVPDVAVSSGSACTAGSPAPSHVLRAMGVPYELAQGSIRFSLGRSSTASEVDEVARRFTNAYEQLSPSRTKKVAHVEG